MSINITELLTRLHDLNGSDLHLASGSHPMARVSGELMPIADYTVNDDEMLEVLREITSPEQTAEFLKTGDLDFSWETVGVARYRVNYYKSFRGVSASFREIPTSVPSMDELGIPKHLQALAMLDRGLVLVTGPTGSGKSTAIASIVDRANAMRKEHILTIEDPIEFTYKNKACFVSQREVGRHTHSFASALRAALREDPDIIVVGEMRDPETISLALEAAETGHLVFATLHTSSAAKTIDRIIDTFPADSQAQIRASLAESLQAILSVSLIKRADGRGRVQAMEILLANTAIRNMVREGKSFQITSVLQTNHNLGMCTMDDQLLKLYDDKVITGESAVRYAQNRQHVSEHINATKK